MTSEVLSADKWGELEHIAEQSVPIPPSTHSFAIVVRDDDGAIVARAYLLFPTTLSGVWIREDARRTLVGWELLQKVDEKVKELGSKMLLACIKPGTPFEGYAQKLGFTRAAWEQWRKDY